MSNLVRNLIVTILVFSIIVVGITLIFIVKTNNTNSSNVQSVNSEQGIDLYGTYNQNDILIKDNLTTYNGLTITVPSIEGLKDKIIEQKVNNNIESKIFDLADNLGLSGDYVLDMHYDVMANFANVISIYYNIFTEDFSKNDEVYLNYNLVDGNEIKFEDMFTSSANVLEIVKKSFYEGMVKQNHVEILDDETGNKYESFFDESMFINEVKSFMDNDNKHFYFNPSEIFIKTNKILAEIKFIDIAESVAIYNKYLTNESIYERDDIGFKGIFTCVNTYYDSFDNIEYGYLEDNFWYDITSRGNYYIESFMSGETLNYLDSVKMDKDNELRAEIEKYRNLAKNNKDKFYIFLAKPSVTVYNKSQYDMEKNEFTYKFSDLADVNSENYIYEMPRNVFDEVYKDKLISAYRNNSFVYDGAIIRVESGDNVTYNEEKDVKVINFITKEEIKSLSDVFYEYSDYMTVIENNIRDNLKQNGINESKFDEYIKNAEYEIDAFYIKVTVPNDEYYSLIISYNIFDESMFKHWL